MKTVGLVVLALFLFGVAVMGTRYWILTVSCGMRDTAASRPPGIRGSSRRFLRARLPVDIPARPLPSPRRKPDPARS